MNPMSWEAVSPLVDRVITEGRTIAAVFRCPVTGEKVSARATMQSAGDGIVPVLGRQLASQAQYNLRQDLARSLRGALGGGILGSVAHEIAWQGTQGAATATRREAIFSEDDKRQAIVRAFAQVQDHFRWDGGWRWATDPAPAWPTRVSMAAPSAGHRAAPSAAPPRAAPSAFAPPAPLATPVAAPPADPRAVRELQLRALVEVAFSDKQLGAEELALAVTLDLDEPAVVALRARPLAAADVAPLDPDDRDETYLLAAAMAYADTQLTRDESASLDRLGGLLGLSRQSRAELDRKAREHLLEVMVRAAHRAGPPSAADQNALRNQALRWGVPPIRLDQITARVQGG
jgi:hypothetical protein